MTEKSDSTATILFALGANLIIAAAKGIAATITGSSAMVAETVHSIADTGNQILLLLGLRLAQRPPDREHPLGYGREIYFWSFIVALMLFTMGGVFSIYEGIHKLHNEAPLSEPWVAITVLLVSIVAESVSLWKCLQQVNELRGEASLWRWFRETRHSDLLVVLGEDLAATLGLSLALLAVAATMVTGNHVYDAFGSLAIGALLLIVAGAIGGEVKALLVGQSADPALRAEIRRFLDDRSEIQEIFNLITLQHGADVVIAVKARMTENVSAPIMIAEVNRCERALRERFPQVRWLFFEPDLHD